MKRPTAKSPTKVFQSVMDCYENGNKLLVHSGGTSSGKTYSIIQALFTICCFNKHVVTVTGQDRPNLTVGPYRDAQEIIAGDPFIQENITDWNKSRMTFTFSTGALIEFDSRQDAQDAKQGKRDILFANEANGIPYVVFEEMNVRTSILSIIDFNPTAEFWAHEKLQINPDTVWINTTFRHNKFIKKSVRDSIMGYEPTPENIKRGTANEYRWKVYGLGEVGRLEGLVFPDFKQTNEWPTDPKWIVYGMDFGYTNDPTTLVEARLHAGGLYLREYIYDTGLTNQDIAKRLESISFDPNDEIVADSAEPKSIEELRRLGWNIKPAEKGPDSIINGIDALKRYNLYIWYDSKNLLSEFSQYTWKKDRDGKAMNKPIDAFNHAIDATRYAVQVKINAPSPKKLFIARK